MSEVFVEKVDIRVSDVDMYNHWKLSSIFSCIQEASGHHMNTIKSGREDLLAHGLAWVVARSKVEMVRYPGFDEQITVKTWAANPIKFLYPRYTILEDEQGVEIGKAVVIWSVIDLGTHKLVTVPNELVKFFDFDRNALIPLSFPAKLEFEGLDSSYSYKIGFTDMDVNQHVNNAKYLDWICNAIDNKYLKDHTPKSIQINYLHETYMGEIIKVDWAISDNCLKVTGSDQNAISFNALLEF